MALPDWHEHYLNERSLNALCTQAVFIGWMQKRVALDDDTAAADWWKIFVLQLLSHCFPPLVSISASLHGALLYISHVFAHAFLSLAAGARTLRNTLTGIGCVCSFIGRSFGCACANSMQMKAPRRRRSRR